MRPLTPSELASRDVTEGHAVEWRVERAGWVIIALILLTALLGGLGNGPLAHASRSAGAARLDFDRIVRHGSPVELRLAAGADAMRNGRILVSFDSAFSETASVRHIQPAPVASSNTASRLTFEFSVPDGATESTIVFALEHRRIGRIGGRLTVQEDIHLPFHQFVLP